MHRWLKEWEFSMPTLKNLRLVLNTSIYIFFSVDIKLQKHLADFALTISWIPQVWIGSWGKGKQVVKYLPSVEHQEATPQLDLGKHYTI